MLGTQGGGKKGGPSAGGKEWVLGPSGGGKLFKERGRRTGNRGSCLNGKRGRGWASHWGGVKNLAPRTEEKKKTKVKKKKKKKTPVAGGVWGTEGLR